MPMTHNQMAYVAIVSTMIFGSLFVGASGYLQTADEDGLGNYDSAAEENIFGEGTDTSESLDSDGDGIPDRNEETIYGTDPLDPDTDQDGLDDGWEIANGLNPNDSGDVETGEVDPGQAAGSSSEGKEVDGWPDPEDGPNGDPDNDGLTNTQEQELGTDPKRSDSDSDGLNDRWESLHTYTEIIAAGNVTMFDPLSGNWDCLLLDSAMIDSLKHRFDGEGEEPAWGELASTSGSYSCDKVLDSDDDGLANFEEESYGTNPTSEDSDGDMIPDRVEVSTTLMTLSSGVGDKCGQELVTTIDRMAPFSAAILQQGKGWFTQDMDEDGRNNGPSDWDTDGDGMSDGYELCYASKLDQPKGDDKQVELSDSDVLDAGNSSDSYADWDEDGLSNLEEFQVSFTYGPTSFTSPWKVDSDDDKMPDGWEASNGLDPKNGSNADLDPDRDGWDADGDGSVTYPDLILTGYVSNLYVEEDDWVDANDSVGRIQVTESGGNQMWYHVYAPVSGKVYSIDVNVGDEISSRSDVWMVIVEPEEQFTNLMEYQARDKNGDGVVDGRSTDPLNPDTDGDGLLDGIEVMGWEILVVNRGVQRTMVTSDPGLWDTDSDGLSDFMEFGEVCAQGSNASNADTDGDGLGDQAEALNGFVWEGERYFTSPCMFDTDNDELEDGEEVILGKDGFQTHANNSDTDDDGLKDGAEVMFVPRPFQSPVNPLMNDTDADGMLDGWEMQVLSVEDDSRTHSLWVAWDQWLPHGCEAMNECGLPAGGYIWKNWNAGFIQERKYSLEEMNLTGFANPYNDMCSCTGRWALDPSGYAKDDTFDIDNDSLSNSAEGPDRWDTNPINDDTDGDLLPDGYEVYWSMQALQTNLTNATELGARGIMDPALADSDFDGIKDGAEDPDHDGLNRTGLLKKYCPNALDSTNANCHINPATPDGLRFYVDHENYTTFEEYENMTNPISEDTDGDDWKDGPEVYYQDHDNDDMATGWEFYFNLDPFDPSDRNADQDGDMWDNWCEFKWNTNPLEINSKPDQGQTCVT